MSDVRVLLGVASSGVPSAPFIEGLKGLQLPLAVTDLKRSVAVGNYIPAQRELIMLDAVESDFDFLFFVDDDIVLPPDALELLLQTMDADPRCAVAGGLYYSRDSMRPIAVEGWTSSDTSAAHIPAFTSTSTNEVDGIGFGCALLRIAPAKTFAEPFFAAHIYIERSARRARLCDEDYLYCERVRDAGYTVRLDARVRCAHYDRATDTFAPAAWETDAATDHARMIAIQDGIIGLAPLDESVPRISERHRAATVTYISVD